MIKIKYLNNIPAPPGFLFELISDKHTPYILSWRNNPKINQYFFSHQKLNKEKQKAFLSKYKDLNRLDYVLIDEISKEAVGVFSLTELNTAMPEIGKLLGNEKFRGQGIAQKATFFLIKFAFKELGLKALYAKTLVDNKINIHVNEKLGFKIVRKMLEKNKKTYLMQLDQE